MCPGLCRWSSPRHPEGWLGRGCIPLATAVRGSQKGFGGGDRNLAASWEPTRVSPPQSQSPPMNFIRVESGTEGLTIQQPVWPPKARPRAGEQYAGPRSRLTSVRSPSHGMTTAPAAPPPPASVGGFITEAHQKRRIDSEGEGKTISPRILEIDCMRRNLFAETKMTDCLRNRRPARGLVLPEGAKRLDPTERRGIRARHCNEGRRGLHQCLTGPLRRPGPPARPPPLSHPLRCPAPHPHVTTNGGGCSIPLLFILPRPNHPNLWTDNSRDCRWVRGGGFRSRWRFR